MYIYSAKYDEFINTVNKLEKDLQSLLIERWQQQSDKINISEREVYKEKISERKEEGLKLVKEAQGLRERIKNGDKTVGKTLRENVKKRQEWRKKIKE
ncbi:MAG: hypothetical protein DRI94_02920 [Bacteroidetes bacterium]|nr:MAG: hypothetical protein DRI94_02920 [Bacteroidota bacterium]